MKVSTEVHNRIVAKIKQCSDIVFEKTGQRINPTLDYNLRGVAAGKGGVKGWNSPFISLNATLLMENVEEMINDTVPHEFAHVVQFTVYRGQPRNTGHGFYWKRIMGWLGVDPRRCHTFDVSNAKVWQMKRFKYQCSCRTHEVTQTKVNRMRRGVSYICNSCKEPIRPMNQLVGA